MSRTNLLIMCLCMVALPACNASSSDKAVRWYSPEQVELGARVFADNCAQCHGLQAQGLVKDWKQRLPDGSYPPPPLNGSAHAWHHRLPLLVEIIQQGGALYDGKMPGFKSSLSEAEQRAAIAWFQSLWSDEIYRLWAADRKSSDIPFAPVPMTGKETNTDGE
ncbi:c-type cytochrome [Mariprofundus ferrooxydans]|nr:cytochrome c [Mariprofundus ferrooxydans]